jgi:hypothetical protein
LSGLDLELQSVKLIPGERAPSCNKFNFSAGPGRYRRRRAFLLLLPYLTTTPDGWLALAAGIVGAAGLYWLPSSVSKRVYGWSQDSLQFKWMTEDDGFAVRPGGHCAKPRRGGPMDNACFHTNDEFPGRRISPRRLGGGFREEIQMEAPQSRSGRRAQRAQNVCTIGCRLNLQLLVGNSSASAL